MSVLNHRHNVKLKINCLFQKYLKQLKTLTQIKLYNNVLGVITQSFNRNNFPRVPIILPILQ